MEKYAEAAKGGQSRRCTIKKKVTVTLHLYIAHVDNNSPNKSVLFNALLLVVPQ